MPDREDPAERHRGHGEDRCAEKRLGRDQRRREVVAGDPEIGPEPQASAAPSIQNQAIAPSTARDRALGPAAPSAACSPADADHGKHRCGGDGEDGEPGGASPTGRACFGIGHIVAGEQVDGVELAPFGAQALSKLRRARAEPSIIVRVTKPRQIGLYKRYETRTGRRAPATTERCLSTLGRVQPCAG